MSPLARRVDRLERKRPPVEDLPRMTDAELEAHIARLLTSLTDEELETLSACQALELHDKAPADLVRAWLEQAGRQPRALTQKSTSSLASERRA